MEAVTGYASYALPIATALVGVWLLWTVLRYVRADRGTRVSMRQAVRVRWGWVRLARMAGLTVTDKTPGLLAQITAQKDGATPAPRVLTPRIKVAPDQFGVIVRARTLPQVGLEEYQKSARFLADAWRCTRVSVLPDGPGRVVIRGVRSDPLTTPTAHRPTGLPPVDLTRWELGIDEYAARVCVSLANVPGVTVAGVPGAGKTSGVNRFVCDFAPSPSVQIVTADGKVSRASEGDYADLVKKGRSVGILVILISQKTTGDAIPTFIRDVCPIGLSFAQKTVEAAVAALGDDIRNWPDASPVTLQDPAYVGVAVMAMQGRPGYTRIRTPYVSDADAARVAEDTSHLTADPDLCLDALLRSTGRTATPAPSLTK
ncbi:cell division protein FtsK [Streptomyces microflavus]|uniref:cell division protein FtsK n=1 Tax=Streptomyces microflavus TaxID=1919 RepID=UPI0034191013